MNISANDLKTRGTKVIAQGLAQDEQVFINVRGQAKYVVFPIERYDQIREQELLQAWQDTKADIAAGRSRVLSAKEHIAEIENAL